MLQWFLNSAGRYDIHLEPNEKYWSAALIGVNEVILREQPKHPTPGKASQAHESVIY